MTILFLANIGNRDLVADGADLKAPRTDGERLLNEWKTDETAVRSRLHLRLLAPLLDYVRRLDGRVDEVIVYATDQPESVGQQYREKDTVYCAELAKRLIERSIQPAPRVRVRLTRENPSLHDEMFNYFQRELAKAEFGRPEIARCYVALAGGTPAGNLGLLFAATGRFGKRCNPLYLREGAAVAQKLDVARQLREATLRQVAAQRVADYRFADAAMTLRELREPPLALIQLAEYAQRRLGFDFEAAWHAANSAIAGAAGEERRQLERAVEEIDRLQRGDDERALLAELGQNLRIAYQTGAFLYFLACVVRLEEAAARIAVQRYLPLDFGEDTPAARARRREAVKAAPDLAAYLDSIDVNGRPLDYGQANTITMLACFDYLLADRPGRKPEHTPAAVDRAELTAVLTILRRLQMRLNGLRNKSILAHGYVGTSKEALAAAYNQNEAEPRDLLADLLAVAQAFAPEGSADWHVEAVRRLLLERLGGSDGSNGGRQ